MKKAALVLLVLFALLPGRGLRAKEEAGRPADVWVGKWTAVSRYKETSRVWPWWFVISPANRGYAIRTHTNSPAEILRISRDRLEFRFNDELRTHIEVRRVGNSIVGTVHQPNNSIYPRGTVEGSRETAFGGFFLRGPTTLAWGAEARYELVYVRDGVRKSWKGMGKWKLKKRTDGRDFSLKGDKIGQVRTLRTPRASRSFDEVQVAIRARGTGGPFAKSLATAELVVTVTNVPGQCKALERDLAEASAEVADLRAGISDMEAKLGALRFPNPWDPEIARKLEDEITKERGVVADIAKSKKRIDAAVEGMQTLKRRISALRAKLTRATTEAGRAFSLIEWYKRTASTRQDKIDFVRAFSGRPPQSPDIDAEFLAAWLKARNVAVTRIAVGLVQIGGLITIATSTGLDDVVSNAFQFGVSTYVDSKIDSAAVLSDTKLGDKAVRNLVGGLGEVARLARSHQDRQAAGAPKKELHKLEVDLNRAALKALVQSVDALRALRPALSKSKQLRRETHAELAKRTAKLAQLEKQLKKAEMSEENRDYEILGAKTLKRELTHRLEKARKKLAAREQRWTELQELHEKHCGKAPSAPRPPKIR